MPKILPTTRFGNPVLRKKGRHLSVSEIKSSAVQQLIANMRYTVEKEKYGVGLAASQVGEPLALSLIAIKPTPSRPNLERFETVLINPRVVKTFGEPSEMWEGCVSCGAGDDTLYAKVPRYKKIELKWHDETGTARKEVLTDFIAHVAQHETDHTNGVLFVDRVEDSSSYMMADEYRERIVKRGGK